jgi:glycosyltransferase involved in cell wall biosynthesis
MLIGALPPPVGGTTVSFRLLMQELQQEPGVEVCVVNTNASTTRQGRFAAPLAMGSGYLRATGQLLKQIASCDVVTLHASYRGTIAFGPTALTICRLFGRPFILREFGGSLDNEYTRASAGAKRALSYLFTASRVLLQTRALIDFFSREFPGSRCVWFATSRPAAPTPTRAATIARRFVFIGHVKPSKGIREILRASALLGNHDVEIDIYGPMSDGIALEEFSDVKNVRYRGILEPDGVAGVLAGYDVLLLPTYHDGEGYPGIVLEAFMAGVPCIATSWKAIPELVQDGTSGILIPPRDVSALAGAIERLLEMPELLPVLRAGALATAARFESHVWTRRFVEICTDAVNEPRTTNRAAATQNSSAGA